MNKRSVMIAFPGAAAPEEIQSDATTWGELRKEIESALNQDFYNQKVRDHKTNHHYSDDAAQLPAEPLKLLVSTDKNKSGGVTKGNYHKAKFSDLRTFCKKTTGFAPNGKDACIKALDFHYGKTSAPVEADKPKADKPTGGTTKANVPATPKKGSIEARLKALEEEVFGSNGKSKSKAKDDSYLQAARELE